MERGGVTWVKLDDAFWANPKVVAVGNEAAGAYARMLSYCGQQLTDGLIEDHAAKIITRPSVCRKLAENGFLERNGKGWRIPDFLEFNPSRDKVLETRRKRAAAGKRGGEASSNGAAK
jgi:hypothetical protein